MAAPYASGAVPGRTPTTLSVGEDELHLWMLRQPWTSLSSEPLMTAELDEHERDKADSFMRAHDRLLYTAAHIALRRLLSAYSGIPPARLRFAREPCAECSEPHGRPVLAPGMPRLHFSLSHSSGLVAFGIARSPVGIDVEKLPTEETVELCIADLHPREQAELAELTGEERLAAFARLWTRKEAYLKGIGTGLSRDLALDYLGGGVGGRPSASPPGWTVLNLPPGSSHVTHSVAAAVEGSRDYCTTVRWLRADTLYAPDPAGVITNDEPRVCATLPASASARSLSAVGAAAPAPRSATSRRDEVIHAD
ncbi:4'-phosphopantetheinyl transferase superfamily protein [Streptomyces sp. TRM 70351]|uniref:4'-phosphopantetheinyl transferase family protein n=1 Tax=Streptomyces sp. TRM 70351 TaxID=3116552 RepID=UPI002E7B4263|nr:4'-phosphopantetheinyl transferase superfamily protein [Streptomyces sp. TRM 70351]MEE1930430.1 4'-phosphopantetheinyl transferase superfamily protein [Streptomyces sp. TRM 70351]